MSSILRHLNLNTKGFKKCFSSQSYTMELLPEVEKQFSSSSLKHRKHPGIRKKTPIQLPSNLISAVKKLLSNENETILYQEASILNKNLFSRRLPLDIEEVHHKIRSVDPSCEHLEDIPEVLKKGEMQQLRKQIQAELGRWKPLEYTHYHGMVYLVARLAANYASICKVFSEIKDLVPSFKPTTVFDFGSGIGSAVWAANSLWSDAIKEYFCVDASKEMSDISQSILTDEVTGESLIKNVYFRQFLPASENIKYDLVVSAFSMVDLPSTQERIRVIDTLWRKTNDFLVVIEFGNLAGFHAILDARDYILHIENQTLANHKDNAVYRPSGAHVLSPCPHEFSCPRLKERRLTPCGFHVSYESLFPSHRQLVHKDWISYVVLRKGARAKDSLISWPRVVKPILKKDKHVYCRLCCNDGELREIITTKSKHGRHAYRCARSSTLGDLLPVTIKPLLDETGIETTIAPHDNDESDASEENNNAL